jgi:hypothetical protein
VKIRDALFIVTIEFLAATLSLALPSSRPLKGAGTEE